MASRDYEGWEIASAVIIAVCVQVGTATGMYLAKYEEGCAQAKKPQCSEREHAECIYERWSCEANCEGTPPECSREKFADCTVDGWTCTPCELPERECEEPGYAQCTKEGWICKDSVSVKPSVDEEAFALAKAGGKKAKLPQMWERAPESVRREVKERPAPPPPPEAGAIATSSAVPPDADRDWGATDAAYDKDAAVEREDAAPHEGEDAGQVEGTDSGVAQLDPDGGESNSGEPGCQGPGCSKDGTGKDFVAAQYAGRLQAFFKRGFTVSGLGLPPEEIKRLAASVSVTLSADGTVTGFSMGSSGNPTFDAAARAQIQSKVGSQVPPAPEDRPELQKTALSLTLTCGSGCN